MIGAKRCPAQTGPLVEDSVMSMDCWQETTGDEPDSTVLASGTACKPRMTEIVHIHNIRISVYPDEIVRLDKNQSSEGITSQHHKRSNTTYHRGADSCTLFQKCA